MSSQFTTAAGVPIPLAGSKPTVYHPIMQMERQNAFNGGYSGDRRQREEQPRVAEATPQNVSAMLTSANADPEVARILFGLIATAASKGTVAAGTVARVGGVNTGAIVMNKTHWIFSEHLWCRLDAAKGADGTPGYMFQYCEQCGAKWADSLQDYDAENPERPNYRTCPAKPKVMTTTVSLGPQL